jgi:curved DNA-binding protein CbpA
MPLKDYYQILEIEPGADEYAIKKAYRRLAMQFHPDKSGGYQEDGGLFRDIIEAYEVLSDPSKREQYHYERWLHQSMGAKLQGYLNAYQIYQVILESEKYLSGIDQYKINDYALLNVLLNLFSTSRIQTIAAEKNSDLEKNTIAIAMKMAGNLKSDCQKQLKERMSVLTNDNPSINAMWETTINNKIRSERNLTYTIPIILLIVVALCVLFYLLGKSN